MPKPEDQFYIGEIAAACGVNISALRFYETKGILKPAHKNPDSCYRYYNRENLLRLRTVLGLRDAGLSLPEIKACLDGNIDVEAKTAELEERRDQLNQAIEYLKIRRTPPGDLAVHEIVLPDRLCLCRAIRVRGGDPSFAAIGEFYEEIIKSGATISKAWPEFYEYTDEKLLQSEPITDFAVTVCVPVDAKNAPSETVLYPSGSAVAVNYRDGCYGLWEAYKALRQYMESHGYVSSGYAQKVCLEIRSEGSAHPDGSGYITRMMVPVKRCL
jgi:DNA-binding transcriptional MerR regulator